MEKKVEKEEMIRKVDPAKAEKEKEKVEIVKKEEKEIKVKRVESKKRNETP